MSMKSEVFKKIFMNGKLLKKNEIKKVINENHEFLQENSIIDKSIIINQVFLYFYNIFFFF